MDYRAVSLILAGFGAAFVAGCHLLPGSAPPELQPVVQYESTEVSVIAGGVLGYFDGPSAEAKFMNLYGLALDASGSLYVADHTAVGDKYYHRIRKIDATGTVSTIAGGEAGLADGSAAEARFSGPIGLAMGSDHRLYVSDSYNNLVRVVGPDGGVSTLAGGVQGVADGTGSEARFFLPRDMAASQNGLIYLADRGNIRKITASGEVSTLAGTAVSPQSVLQPNGIGIDSQGNVLVADTERSVILRISPAGEVTVLAGVSDGRRVHVDGPALQARFLGPVDVAADAIGNVYVADGDGTVRRISSQGMVTTLAGAPQSLTGIAVDSSGSVLVLTASRIMRIEPR